MPSNTRRARRTEVQRPRIGRPPRPDAGDWQKFYVVLRTPTAEYVRAEASGNRDSFSKVIGNLVEEGIAARAERNRIET